MLTVIPSTHASVLNCTKYGNNKNHRYNQVASRGSNMVVKAMESIFTWTQGIPAWLTQLDTCAMLEAGHIYLH